jgi:hypothetical protein
MIYDHYLRRKANNNDDAREMIFFIGTTGRAGMPENYPQQFGSVLFSHLWRG